MKPILKAAVAGLLTAAIAGGGVLGLAGASFAAGSAPAWEPDGNAAAPYGNLTFYDANGNEVTSGTNLTSPFSYVVAGTSADSGATKASLNFFNPQHGVVPASWTGTAEAGPTVFSPSLSGAPTDITAYAPTYPVVAASSADISTWLASNVPDTTAGYANTIQVRLTDSGPGGHGNPTGTYWESDIGYNTTTSPITVDGTTVPANGWAVLFPLVTATTTSLTTSATGGNVTTGSPITLTATVPSGDAGTVQFYDGTTILGDVTPSGGSAAYTYTPAAGTHVYTASFVPTLGDETGAYSTTAGILGGSTSSAVTVQDTPPQTGTTTALSASSNSIAYGASDTFTATVGASDNSTAGVAGAVEFLDGTTAITGCAAQATTVTGAGTTASPGVGTATCATTSLPAGSNSITAVFTPTSNTYATSTSAAVVVTVSGPAACSLTGSSCSDTQNITVTVNPGTITISTPYTAANPFVLPAMALSSDGTYLQSSATFPGASASSEIVVTSSLAPAQAWTLSVAATSLTSSGGGTIPSTGLGLTNGALVNASGPGAYLGTVTFTGIPALNPSPVDGAGTGPGLSATPQTFATSTAADGTALMNGTLTLDASTATPAGTYTGTITFSVS